MRPQMPLTVYEEVSVMLIKTATCMALAAACLAATVPTTLAQTGGPTVVVTEPPRVDPGDLNWNPQRNVMESQQYDRLLETDPSFRTARIRMECGPITDPQLRANCVASFSQFEPLVASTPSPRRFASSTRPRRHYAHGVGSSMAPRHYRSYYGR
jgi:ABC-type transport system substrate-binding protein